MSKNQVRKCKILMLDSQYLLRFKSCQSSWLDSYLDRWLSIEVYETQFFKTVFHQIHKCMFEISFLTTLNIYKDYFKGRKR